MKTFQSIITTALFLLVTSTLLPTSVSAKVVLTDAAKPAIDPSQVKISFYDRGQFNHCEEIGLAHSQNTFGMMLQTKKGMLNRIKKQAAKVGATDILMTESKLGEFSGVQQGEGVAFYCKRDK